MKVECLIENIEKHLSLLAKVIPSHAQIPVFANVLIEAKSDGLYLCTTDLDLGVRVKIPAKIEEEGAVTVPGKQFVEVINSLPKDKITLESVKGDFFIYCRGDKVAFQTIPKEEFPNLFEKKGEKVALFKKREFEEIFSKLIFAVSKDDTRPILTGILFSQKDGESVFVGTDGYRLSVKKLSRSVLEGEEQKMILSARLIEEALQIKTDAQEIVMYVFKEGNQVLFESGDIFLIGRLIEGEFPNYERVIPSSYKTKLEIEVEVFLQALRLASVFARESANIVKFKIEGDELRITAKASGLGEGEARLEVEKEGEDNEISFNVRFVLDFLKNAAKGQVVVEFNNSLESCLFKIKSDDSYLHVIMPVRVQE